MIERASLRISLVFRDISYPNGKIRTSSSSGITTETGDGGKVQRCIPMNTLVNHMVPVDRE